MVAMDLSETVGLQFSIIIDDSDFVLRDLLELELVVVAVPNVKNIDLMKSVLSVSPLLFVHFFQSRHSNAIALLNL